MLAGQLIRIKRLWSAFPYGCVLQCRSVGCWQGPAMLCCSFFECGGSTSPVHQSSASGVTEDLLAGYACLSGFCILLIVKGCVIVNASMPLRLLVFLHPTFVFFRFSAALTRAFQNCCAMRCAVCRAVLCCTVSYSSPTGLVQPGSSSSSPSAQPLLSELSDASTRLGLEGGLRLLVMLLRDRTSGEISKGLVTLPQT